MPRFLTNVKLKTRIRASRSSPPVGKAAGVPGLTAPTNLRSLRVALRATGNFGVAP
jgi:hypothetical protein